MHELLSFAIVVEPDRQRLARFAMDALQFLGADSFRATAALARILPRLRKSFLQSEGHLQTRLILERDTVYLEWNDSRDAIITIGDPPGSDSLKALGHRLCQASESTDPELLIQRNQRITADFERAREQAANEVAELERVLEKKKVELKESIHLAETDSLTALFNRGAFDIRLREIFLRSKRQREPLCLIALDVDNFKQINDSHGHQYGDDYLKRMADAMRTATREHVDYCCRMGGDEFAIIACTHHINAQRISEKVLELMESGISIGIAEMRTDDSIESLMGRADSALYKVKRNGRGHIAFAGETVEMEQLQANQTG